MHYAVEILTLEQPPCLATPRSMFLDGSSHLLAIGSQLRASLTLGSPEAWPSLWPILQRQLQPALDSLTGKPPGSLCSLHCQIHRQAQKSTFCGTIEKLDPPGFVVSLAAQAPCLDLQTLRGNILGELTPSIVHALRNPLNTMGVHLFLLDEQANQQHPLPNAEIQRYADVLRQECQRLNGLIDSLITCVLPPSPCAHTINLGPLLEHLLVFIQPLARHAGIGLSYQFVNTPLWVANPQGRLSQAILLLLLAILKLQTRGDTLALDLHSADTAVLLCVSAQGDCVASLECDATVALLQDIGGELRQAYTTESTLVEIQLPLSHHPSSA